MPHEKILKAKLSTVAYFPPEYFLENLAVRQDNSILVTVANRHELWFVPPVNAEQTVAPVLLSTFAEVACGITEVEPDIFYIATGKFLYHARGVSPSFESAQLACRCVGPSGDGPATPLCSPGFEWQLPDCAWCLADCRFFREPDLAH